MVRCVVGRLLISRSLYMGPMDVSTWVFYSTLGLSWVCCHSRGTNSTNLYLDAVKWKVLHDNESWCLIKVQFTWCTASSVKRNSLEQKCFILVALVFFSINRGSTFTNILRYGSSSLLDNHSSYLDSCRSPLKSGSSSVNISTSEYDWFVFDGHVHLRWILVQFPLAVVYFKSTEVHFKSTIAKIQWTIDRR